MFSQVEIVELTPKCTRQTSKHVTQEMVFVLICNVASELVRTPGLYMYVNVLQRQHIMITVVMSCSPEAKCCN